MTRVIYIDSLFVLNFVLDFILVALTADLCGIYCSRRRQAAAAALGGLLAVLLYIPPVPAWLGLVLRLGSCLAVCRLAFPKESGRGLGRCCGLLFLLSAALAGTVGALVLLSGGAVPAQVRNGVVQLQIPVWKQLAAGAACWCLLRMLLHGGSLSQHRAHRVITIREGERSLRLRALVDTGNFLRDPVSGRRVILVDPAALSQLLPLPKEPDPVRQLEFLSACSPRFSLMNYRTADRENGLLVTWRPAAILEEDKPLEGYIIGIAPSSVNTDDGCRAIIGG